jgi:hypothetical protein
MARARYRDPLYQQAIRIWTLTIERHGARCSAKLCLWGDRTIPAGAPRTAWDMGHDETGHIITGPEHRRCNRHEGSVRGNHLRAMRRRAAGITPTRTPTTHTVSVNQW